MSANQADFPVTAMARVLGVVEGRLLRLGGTRAPRRGRLPTPHC